MEITVSSADAINGNLAICSNRIPRYEQAVSRASAPLWRLSRWQETQVQSLEPGARAHGTTHPLSGDLGTFSNHILRYEPTMQRDRTSSAVHSQWQGGHPQEQWL